MIDCWLAHGAAFEETHLDLRQVGKPRLALRMAAA